MYEYRANMIRIIDGDTFHLDVDLGFYIRQEQYVRLASVDTPEIRGEEREAGLKAKQFVEDRIPPGTDVEIKSYLIGSFGRFVADVFYWEEGERKSLANELLNAGLAEHYAATTPKAVSL